VKTASLFIPKGCARAVNRRIELSRPHHVQRMIAYVCDRESEVPGKLLLYSQVVVLGVCDLRCRVEDAAGKGRNEGVGGELGRIHAAARERISASEASIDVVPL